MPEGPKVKNLNIKKFYIFKFILENIKKFKQFLFEKVDIVL